VWWGRTFLGAIIDFSSTEEEGTDLVRLSKQRNGQLRSFSECGHHQSGREMKGNKREKHPTTAPSLEGKKEESLWLHGDGGSSATDGGVCGGSEEGVPPHPDK